MGILTGQASPQPDAAHHKSSASSPGHQGLITVEATVGNQNRAAADTREDLEAPASGVTAAFVERVSETARAAPDFDVPIIVEAKAGATWADAH
jgi:hypothetical protein